MELTPNADSSKALFLDRDGTLIVDKGHCGDPARVELIPGAREGLILALEAGYRLFLHSNQLGVGLGILTEAQVTACQERMFELLDLPEGLFTTICLATENPDTPIRDESWRKPSPRFILEMIKTYQLDPNACFMVGDRDKDWKAGLRAGIQAVAVRTGAILDQDLEVFLANNRIPAFRQFYSFARTL